MKTRKKITTKKGNKKVKKSAKKPARKTIAAKPIKEKPIGRVTHFYTAIKVAIVKFKVPVKAGAAVKFRGATTDFSQKIDSMQFDHKAIKLAPKNKLIGLKVKKRVREGDGVFKD